MYRFSSLSLFLSLYHPTQPTGLPNYILDPQRADVN